MEAVKAKDILIATKGQLISGNIDIIITDITTDSRKVNKGMLFIPLIGEKFDGHEFISTAFKAGAVACLTEKDISICFESKCVIKVENVSVALQDIARYYRDRFKIPFIAITGSVGKTTTKDMIYSILSKEYSVLKTLGNFNNEIGLPLTIFGLNKDHEIAVTEMGMSGFGEIRRLVSIVKPKTAVITNIGMSHIENLGSKINILKAKSEIFESLDPGGTAILNGDDPLLLDLKGKLAFKTVYFGINNKDCEIQAYNICNYDENGSTFDINVNNESYNIKVPVMGQHNIYNALGAIAVALEYQVDIKKIISGMESFKSEDMRLEIIECKKLTLVNDCYNASPESMKAALKVLDSINKGKSRKIAILGDMLEMGKWAFDSHKEVGRYIAQSNISDLITVGVNGRNIALGAINQGMAKEKVLSFNNNKEVINFISEFLQDNDIVLIKASRGMKMESIVQYIQEVR